MSSWAERNKVTAFVLRKFKQKGLLIRFHKELVSREEICYWKTTREEIANHQTFIIGQFDIRYQETYRNLQVVDRKTRSRTEQARIKECKFLINQKLTPEQLERQQKIVTNCQALYNDLIERNKTNAGRQAKQNVQTLTELKAKRSVWIT
jgi:hypothetical protein